jgi:hypothetical protein
MVNVESLAASRQATPWHEGAPDLADRVFRLAVFGASVGLAIAWTLMLGRALHWDAVNYHFYLGFAAFHDRFALDFLAAGTPSYINPYAYVPLYLLNRAGLSAGVVATVLATVHALALWLTYEMALAIAPEGATRERQGFAMLAWVLAALSPVLLQGIGMTLVDIPLGALVIAAWLTLVASLRHATLRWVALGAAIGGVAAALKLSNALYAAAGMSMLVFFPGTGWRKLAAAAVYGAACGLAFTAVSAPWSVRLWQEFGNPLFPLLNDVFRSPDFTTAPLDYERFRPASFWEFVGRPIEMLSPRSRQHTEGRAPDLRFAVLFIALGVAAVAGLRRVLGRREGDGWSRALLEDARILTAVAVAFVVAWVLWIKASGNSRYFLPMGCVGAALLATLLHRAYVRSKGRTLVAIVLLLIAQTVQIAVGSDWRRDGLAWDGPLLPTRYAERFRSEPYLFLSTSFLSGSAFLPHWHPESGMITITGFYSLGPGRPGWERAQAMIGRNVHRLRSLTPYDESTGLPGPASNLDVYIRRFGLAIDFSDCEFVKAQTSFADRAYDDKDERWTTWLTCRLRPDPRAAERYAREVSEIDTIFDRVEAKCPNLFHPPKPATEQMPNWTRLYNMGSEIQLWISDGRLRYLSPRLGGDAIDIGTVEAWAQGAQPIDCTRKSLPAFGGLAQ